MFGTVSQHGQDTIAGWLFLAVIIIIAVWQVPHLIRSLRSTSTNRPVHPGDRSETDSASMERPESAAGQRGTGQTEESHEPLSFVTLASFSTAVEAHILRGRLESEGIRTNIADEETVTMAWHLGQAVGGIKVQVFSEDAERARAIIDTDAARQEITSHVEEEDADVRSIIARRALLASFFGLVVPPLQLYSLWLVGRLLSSHFGPIQGVRGKITLALVLNTYFFIFVFYIFRMFATYSA